MSRKSNMVRISLLLSFSGFNTGKFLVMGLIMEGVTLLRKWRFIITAGLVCWPTTALAIQTHGHPEGLYAHQMGHLAFLGAMIYVCWQLWRRGLLERPGFRRLFWACILFGLWNVLTFLGHWAEEGLAPGAIDRQAGHFFRQLHITDLGGLIYYLATLDHLVLVPALGLLYLAIRAFAAETREKQEGL